MKTAHALEHLPNLGPKSAQWLNHIGIHNLDDIKTLGPVNTHLELKRQGYKVSLNMLWALAGAVYGYRWNQLPAELKTSLLVELDGQQDAERRYARDSSK